MANNIIKRVWNRNRMVNIESLQGMAFQAESGGHTFEIYGVNDAGTTVPISGTIAGVFLRPDNTDVALTGSVVDGVARVTLTQACYAVTGRFGLTIFADDGGLKTAVYACIGTVSRTTSGNVAGSTPQDVVDLINAINTAIAGIPASYTDLMAGVAPTYSNLSVYAFGSYAWYNGKLYRCKAPITTAESWTAAHWESVALTTDFSKKPLYLVKCNSGTWDDNEYTTTAIDSTEALISVSGNSLFGTYVIYDHKRYALYEVTRVWTNGIVNEIKLRSESVGGIFIYGVMEFGGAETQVTFSIGTDATLPSITAEDKGKYLHVNSSTGALEYAALPTYDGGVS